MKTSRCLKSLTVLLCALAVLAPGVSASGTGESVWVSADGVWHFMAGIQSPAGIVTNETLGTAIAGTSANTNNVQLLGLTVSDPPTQSEMQAIANKLDELITAQRR